jgi:hypothetical protein
MKKSIFIVVVLLALARLLLADIPDAIPAADPNGSLLLLRPPGPKRLRMLQPRQTKPTLAQTTRGL